MAAVYGVRMRIVEVEEFELIRAGDIPTHLACIMDGNGRWGQMRGLKRSEGHAAAEATVDAVVDACLELGINWLTVYAFSTENWTREDGEVRFLMSFREWLLRRGQRDSLIKRGVRFRFIGDLEDHRIQPESRKWIADCERLSEHNETLNLVIAFNYGGRAELVNAAQVLASAGETTPIDESSFRSALYCPDMPDVDLLLRTSSEHRLSNFLPWHTAYAEFVFVDTLWPDIRGGHIYSAVAEYQTRRRRKGGMAELR